LTLPPFDLHRARSVEEAGELLGRYGDDAVVYCGGTELLLLYKLGFAFYGHLVDVKPIEELAGIRRENGTVAIGATATHREIERSPVVLDAVPALAEMERRVANIRVRNVGTLGGNLCFSDPHSDPATFLLAAEAEVECRKAGGSARRLPIRDFVVGPHQTALEPGELLVSVRVPVPPPEARIVHRKLAFHERPAVTVCCLVRVEAGAVAEARVAVGSVGAVPVRAAEAERALTGKAADDDVALAEAAELAAEASRPVEDANGSIDYKANLVRVLVARTFREATA
jgi:aerobic carbon-monoxide dehydrogenase medium subunit